MHSEPNTLDRLAEILLGNKSITPDGCWEWQGGRSGKTGYGVIRVTFPDGTIKKVGVHRIAAMLWKGFNLDSELFVLHHCDNPPCFNPDHIDPGTPSQNIQDAVSRHRPHVAYIRKNKTHCAHGHEFIPSNIYWDRGCRRCKTCCLIRQKQRDAS